MLNDINKLNEWQQEYIKLCNNIHPASLFSFNELYAGLEVEVEKGTVNKSTIDGDLFIYKYNAYGLYDNPWNVFSLISRGLILSTTEKRIVALPFFKFFNLSEMSYYSPVKTGFTAYSKLDGSLGIIYNYKNSWRVATAGSLNSEQAIWATEYLNNNIELSLLDKDITYLAEIIYTENRIVIKYDTEGLFLLGAYSLKTFREVPYFNLMNLQGLTNFGITKAKTFKSVDDIVKCCETLPGDKEGFVVRFDNGYRVKVKGAEYLAIHKLRFELSPITIWERMLNGGISKDDLALLPEEFHDEIFEIRDILQSKFDRNLEEIKLMHDLFRDKTDKQVGQAIIDDKCADSPAFSDAAKSFIFSARKKNFLEEVHIPGSKLRESFFKTFYPKGNSLEGI